jgi:putative tryptophan/tyrosine transport system substrate-binding protein
VRRRVFIALLAAAVLGSAPARSQPAERIYRIGMLEAVPAEQNAPNLDAFRMALRALGYSEGRNLVIEYRSADGHAERFPALAAELVARKVDLIVARGTPATRAAQGATSTVPTVMATMGDPSALVASFARPGGNVTGVTTFSTELMAKRVEILRELVPTLSHIALLHNMGNPAAPPEWEETKRAAEALGLAIDLLDVRRSEDLAGAFDKALALRIDALTVGFDGLIQLHRKTIADFAARQQLPAVYPAREFVEAGGLVAYAVNYPKLYSRFASFADKIFRGAKPGDLPIEQPTEFELVLNVGLAKALGLTLPSALLSRVDEVIE